jgi:hypothetical protein
MVFKVTKKEELRNENTIYAQYTPHYNATLHCRVISIGAGDIKGIFSLTL